MTAPTPAFTEAPGPGVGSTLNDYGLLLRRRWWVLVVAGLLGLAVAAAYTAGATRTYTSVTDVLVTATGVQSDSVSATARTRAEINLDTEAQLLVSTAVVEDARDRLGLGELTLDQVVDRVSITVPPNTEVLTIRFAAGTPEEARAGASAFALAYLANRAQLATDQVDAQRSALQAQSVVLTESLRETTAALAGLEEGSAERALAEAQVQSLSTQIALLTSDINELGAIAPTPGRVITAANLPRSPSEPVVAMNLAGGLMLGLLAGIAVAVVLHRRDTRLRTAADVRRDTGLEVLATLPPAASTAAAEVAQRTYGRLRNLVSAHLARSAPVPSTGGPARAGDPADPRPAVLLLSGTTADSDTSSVAVGLTLALAATGAEVLLVSTYRGSGAARRLGVGSSGPGLADVLDRRRQLGTAVRPVPGHPGVSVLTVGTDPARAADALQTPRGGEVIAALRERAQYVVLDAPPTDGHVLTQTLAPYADAVLLSVTARQSRQQDVRDALDQLTAVGATVLGGVLLPAPPRRGLADRSAEVADAEDEMALARLTTRASARRTGRAGGTAAAVGADEPEPAAEPAADEDPAHRPTGTAPVRPSRADARRARTRGAAAGRKRG